jgi:hypothetical protein
VKPGERPLQIADVSDLKEYAQTISTLCIRDWSVDDDGAVDGRFLGDGSAQEPVDGPCSAAEYQRMTAEKVAAMQTATRALMRGKGQAAMLAPFVSRARSNAKRLRRKT